MTSRSIELFTPGPIMLTQSRSGRFRDASRHGVTKNYFKMGQFRVFWICRSLVSDRFFLEFFSCLSFYILFALRIGNDDRE